MTRFTALIQELEILLQVPLYLVGGAVRNFQLGLEVKDYDFTTPATPDEVEFKIQEAGYKPYTIGKKFGTIGFKYNFTTTSEDNLESVKTLPKHLYIEITTFRTEKYDPGSRKPAVEFVPAINLDLARRDFTVNAMALNSKGEIIDEHNGQLDLQSGIIRAVGVPGQRFAEDPLRMLRAVRFAAEYNFEIEIGTKQAILEGHLRMLDISKERWVMEMDKILTGQNIESALDLLMQTKLLLVVIPELAAQVNYGQQLSKNSDDCWTQTKNTVQSIPRENLIGRWAALLQNIAKPFSQPTGDPELSDHLENKLAADMTLRLATHLKWSKERTMAVYELVLHNLNNQVIGTSSATTAPNIDVHQ